MIESALIRRFGPIAFRSGHGLAKHTGNKKTVLAKGRIFPRYHLYSPCSYLPVKMWQSRAPGALVISKTQKQPSADAFRKALSLRLSSL